LGIELNILLLKAMEKYILGITIYSTNIAIFTCQQLSQKELL
jgi:hypothetical protein